MNWQEDVIRIIRKLDYVKTTLKDLFSGRDTVVDLLALAAVSRENMLLIGPPGTAKTDLISRFCKLVDAESFHYLLTRFTEPSELFGPLDVKKFQEGQYYIRTERMLPNARIAFLDEVFQGNSAILNALLTLVNERIFFNGPEKMASPLISLIGASNFIPDDPWLSAFADRFALRLEVTSSREDQMEELIAKGWALEQDRNGNFGQVSAITHQELTILNGLISQVNVTAIRDEYIQIVRELRSEGVGLSDRRLVKGLKLIAGAAVLRAGTEAQMEDLWPVLHMWGRVEEADVFRRVVEPRLAQTGAATSGSRSTEDLRLDLDVLVAQESMLRTETSIGAHLRRLNDLRRELIVNHPRATDLRKEIESGIQRNIEKLQVANV